MQAALSEMQCAPRGALRSKDVGRHWAARKDKNGGCCGEPAVREKAKAPDGTNVVRAHAGCVACTRFVRQARKRADIGTLRPVRAAAASTPLN